MTEDIKITEGHKSSNTIIFDKSSILSDVKQIIQSNAGIIFEENIRGSLKYEYRLDENAFTRNVIYRKVNIGETPKIIMNKSFLFKINKNYSITIIDLKNPFKKYTFKDNKEMITYMINHEKISIYHHNEIEVDGILIENNFIVPMFGDEGQVIFNNVNKKEEKKIKYAVLETN